MIDTAVHHYHRAQAFLADFKRAKSQEDKGRYLASAVENAVAIVECFQGTVPDANLQQLAWQVPRYRLIKKVRIHNFHRRPIPFVSDEVRDGGKFFAMQGPVSLKVGPEPGSRAWITLGDSGPEYRGA